LNITYPGGRAELAEKSTDVIGNRSMKHAIHLIRKPCHIVYRE